MKWVYRLLFVSIFLGMIWCSRFRWYVFSAPKVEIGHYTVKYMEPFKLDALVVLTKQYTGDQMADFCPIDLALAWGPMAEEGRLDDMTFWQTGRWVYWRYNRDTDVPYWDMRKHLSNMHMIPADDMVRQQLFDLEPGDRILFAGHLVRVDNNEGRGIWVSSRSRADRGGQACEIVYITDLYAY